MTAGSPKIIGSNAKKNIDLRNLKHNKNNIFVDVVS